MKHHSMTDSRRDAFLLALIVIVVGIGKGTLFSMVHAVEPNKMFTPDSASYVNTARAFLKTGHFAVDPEMPDIPQIKRTPGYPLFLASIFFLFGEQYVLLVLIQILLSLGTLIMTYHIASIIWGIHIAVLSALLMALDIPSFMNSQQVLTETVFTFVLNIAILSVIYTLKKPQHVTLLALLHGFFLAVSTLIRPITYYLLFPVILAFAILLKIHLRLSWRRIGVVIVALVLPWILLVGGWQVRNYLLTGKAEFSYIQGVNLWFYRGAGIVAQRDGITFEEAQQRLGYGDFVNFPPEKLAQSIAGLSQHWKRESIRLFRQHPWFLVKDQIRGFIKMMFMPGEHSVLAYIGNYREQTGPIGDIFQLSVNAYIQKWVIGKSRHFTFFLMAEGHLIVFYGSLILSIWHLIKIRGGTLWSIHLFIWIVIIYCIAISVGPEAYYRFRIPIMPLLAVYAGHGLSQILKRCLHDNNV